MSIEHLEEFYNPVKNGNRSLHQIPQNTEVVFDHALMVQDKRYIMHETKQTVQSMLTEGCKHPLCTHNMDRCPGKMDFSVFTRPFIEGGLYPPKFPKYAEMNLPYEHFLSIMNAYGSTNFTMEYFELLCAHPVYSRQTTLLDLCMECPELFYVIDFSRLRDKLYLIPLAQPDFQVPLYHEGMQPGQAHRWTVALRCLLKPSHDNLMRKLGNLNGFSSICPECGCNAVLGSFLAYYARYIHYQVLFSGVPDVYHNTVMYYPRNFEASGRRKDLEKRRKFGQPFKPFFAHFQEFKKWYTSHTPSFPSLKEAHRQEFIARSQHVSERIVLWPADTTADQYKSRDIDKWSQRKNVSFDNYLPGYLERWQMGSLHGVEMTNEFRPSFEF